jgi:hypothetical protein
LALSPTCDTAALQNPRPAYACARIRERAGQDMGKGKIARALGVSVSLTERVLAQT